MFLNESVHLFNLTRHYRYSYIPCNRAKNKECLLYIRSRKYLHVFRSRQLWSVIALRAYVSTMKPTISGKKRGIRLVTVSECPFRWKRAASRVRKDVALSVARFIGSLMDIKVPLSSSIGLFTGATHDRSTLSCQSLRNRFCEASRGICLRD